MSERRDEKNQLGGGGDETAFPSLPSYDEGGREAKSPARTALANVVIALTTVLVAFWMHDGLIPFLANCTSAMRFGFPPGEPGFDLTIADYTCALAYAGCVFVAGKRWDHWTTIEFFILTSAAFLVLAVLFDGIAVASTMYIGMAVYAVSSLVLLEELPYAIREKEYWCIFRMAFVLAISILVLSVYGYGSDEVTIAHYDGEPGREYAVAASEGDMLALIDASEDGDDLVVNPASVFWANSEDVTLSSERYDAIVPVDYDLTKDDDASGLFRDVEDIVL